MGKLITRRRSAFLTAAGLITLVASPSWAASDSEDAAPAASSGEDTGDQVDDIVVTAQRRTERLQDVPIATTVVGNDQLGNSRITEANQLTTLVPNLQINGNFSAVPKITLRGVGTNDFVPNLNPAVGTYIDDVYVGLAIGQNFQIFDIDRVEVLRGPQGTLYGKNTTGGAIKYVTRRPQSDGGDSYGSITVGNYNRFELETGLNLPLSSDWSARVSGVLRKQDGYIDSPLLDRDKAWTDAWGVRGQLRYNPSSSVDILLQAFHGKSDGDSAGRRLEGPLQPGRTDILGNASGGFRQSFNNTPSYEKVRASGVNLIASFDTPLGRLDSVTSYVDITRDTLDDSDNGPRTLVNIGYYTEAWAAGQELRLSGESGPIRWSLGGQYFHEDFDSFFDLDFFGCTADPVPCVLNPNGIALPPGYISFNTFPNAPSFIAAGLAGLPIATSGKYPWTQTNDSYAAFGDASWSITDKLKLTGGLRYSYEKRKFSGESRLYPTLAPQVPGGLFPRGFDRVNLARNWDNISGRLVLDFKPNNDQLYYLSYSTGFRSGNFNSAAYTSLAAISQIVDPEHVRSFEFGAKTQWFDRKLQLNLAAFYMKYSDLQVAVYRNAVQILTNAAAADIKGAELELTTTPLRGLNLRIAAGYLDAQYKNFIYQASPLIDLSGNRLVNAPRWTSTISIDYRTAITDELNVSFGGDVRSQSKVFFNPFNDQTISQSAYSIVNLRAGIEWPSQDIDFNLFMTNATNKVAAVDGIAVGAPFGINSRNYNRPRMFGATLRKKF